MAFTYPSVLDFGLEPAAQVLARGFSDYFVSIPWSSTLLLGLTRTDSVDLAVSRVVVREGEPVAAALIARRGWTSRLAGMAVAPEARRSGVGRELLARLLAEARARGERTMVLEVIEQNTTAVRLYECGGFVKVRRLVGHAGKPTPATATAAPLEEIDPRMFAHMVAEHGLRDLPWQLSAETFAHAAPPAIAYRLGPSAVLLSAPAADPIAIRGLVTERTARGLGHSRTLLQAAMARHPGKEWRAAAIFPEEMGASFAAAGLARTPLSQWQMSRALA